MRNLPTLELCRRTMRTQVCTECPHRTSGTAFGPDVIKPCEKKCPLFINLHVLRDVAQQTDTMVGNRPRIMHDLVRRISRRWHKGNAALQKHVQRVVDVFERLF